MYLNSFFVGIFGLEVGNDGIQNSGAEHASFLFASPRHHAGKSCQGGIIISHFTPPPPSPPLSLINARTGEGAAVLGQSISKNIY